MHTWFDRWLQTRGIVVLDGALATEMERRGADLKDPLWSAKYLIERPDLIRAIHLDYFNAGADVATTATYQATFGAFSRRGIDHEAAAQLMRDAVAIAMSAREEFWASPANRRRPRPVVAASIGPYGAMLGDGSEYRGHYSVEDDELRDFHAARLTVLASSGADLLAFETIPCLREALILAELLAGFPKLSAWMSFSCRDGQRNCEGEDVAICAEALQRFDQIAALGVNCTSPAYVGSLLRRMATKTEKPLLAYPNSGERYDADVKGWCSAEPGVELGRNFAELAEIWYDAGARLIGGCCRTSPADIEAIAQARFNARKS